MLRCAALSNAFGIAESQTGTLKTYGTTRLYFGQDWLSCTDTAFADPRQAEPLKAQKDVQNLALSGEACPDLSGSDRQLTVNMTSQVFPSQANSPWSSRGDKELSGSQIGSPLQLRHRA